MKTLSDVYLETRRALKLAGIEAFSLEAQCIVAGAARKTRAELMRDLKLYATSEFAGRVRAMTERRIAGEPVAYVTGEWEFMGLPISVNRDVLIPRTDTEVLAEKAIALLRGRESGARVLDLCCGSGCIGISIAAALPNCRVVLVDNSMKAIAVTRDNVLRNHVARTCAVIDADAMKAPPLLLGRFDMIVCNPPYIATEEIMTLDESVKDYEPRAALDGGTDGLDFYRAITPRWSTILKDRGCLMYECGEGQAFAVAEIMKQSGFKGISTIKDTIGVDRVVVGIKMQEDMTNG